MIRVRQVKVPIDSDDIEKYVASKLKISKNEIKSLKINKKSIDARRKNDIHFVYEVDITLNSEKKILNKNNKDVLKAPTEVYQFKITGNKELKNRPVIIGAGPAGLFCSYLLANNGYKPIIIERGEKIEDRIKTVDTFWNKGLLNVNSNVQFGEGGAGTFSDGKLNTLVKDKNFRMKKVFEIFMENGAPEEIMYLNNPHVGTDLLQDIIINMRKKIISMGGEFRYNSLMNDIIIKENKIESIVVNNEVISAEALILAIGHSSRDTLRMLYSKNLSMEAKPFAIGIRVQHPQTLINKSQYGDVKLPPASYKLTYKAKDRGVYSFCMCPGGYVVNASSEPGKLAINGMSNHDRNSGVANSAIVVTVSKDDYGTHPLDGVIFQQSLEKNAYELAHGKIPVQLYKDFKDNKVSKEFKTFKPMFKGNYEFANINNIYPKYITDSIKEAMDVFDKKIKGFKADDVILAAPESRTSSPVRIIRDEYFESNIKGIYPVGEGAGYAGGITTAAMDGIKIAEAIASKYRPFN